VSATIHLSPLQGVSEGGGGGGGGGGEVGGATCGGSFSLEELDVAAREGVEAACSQGR